eukprot:COSAG02_NODE_3398_length_6811_cov_26.210965_4_plen_109_part_00
MVVRQTNDEHNRRGDLAIYQEDTVGDVRARIVSVRTAVLVCYACSLTQPLIDANSMSAFACCQYAQEGLSGGEDVSLKRRKVPMMPRNDSQPASKYFSSQADYIVIYK